MPAKKSIEFYDAFARAKGGRCLSTEYVNSKTKYQWQCKKSHEWEAVASDIQQGSWCMVCSGNDKKNIEWLQKLAQNNEGECLSTGYVNSLTKYRWRCQKGHIWEVTAGNVYQGKWCPYCAGHDKKNIEWLQKLAQNNEGECLSTGYVNSLTKYGWQCKEGHNWEAVAGHIQQGQWCPKCSNRKSKPEQEIFELVLSKHPDTQNRARGLLPNKRFELDIYVPSLKKAIEFDGDYWHHSEWAIKHGSKERDEYKTAQCTRLGIQLLRVKWSEYLKNKQSSLSRVEQFLSGP